MKPGGPALALASAFFAVPGGHHLAASGLEAQPVHLSDEGVVVDDEDTGGDLGPSPISTLV